MNFLLENCINRKSAAAKKGEMNWRLNTESNVTYAVHLHFVCFFSSSNCCCCLYFLWLFTSSCGLYERIRCDSPDVQCNQTHQQRAIIPKSTGCRLIDMTELSHKTKANTNQRRKKNIDDNNNNNREHRVKTSAWSWLRRKKNDTHTEIIKGKARKRRRKITSTHRLLILLCASFATLLPVTTGDFLFCWC